MTLLWKSRLFKLGAGALALGAIGLFTPRAAHALAATLVQVTNTISNPAITQGTNTAAGQAVLLALPQAADLNPGSIGSLSQILPTTGNTNTPYVVPAGQTLMVTGMDVTTTNAGGAFMSLIEPNSSGNQPVSWVYLPKAGTQQMTFPTGIAYPSGFQVSVYCPPGFAGTGSADVFVHGYLTTN